MQKKHSPSVFFPQVIHAQFLIITEYPSQDVLIEALNMKLTPDDMEKLREHYLTVGSNLDAALQNNGIDIIVAPGDCFLTQYAAAKGTFPLPPRLC